MTSRMQRVFCWAAAVSVVTGVWAGCQSGPEPADDEEPMMVGSAPVDEASQVVEEAATGAEGQAPSRIIFFIGDGMGISSVTAAAYAEGRVLNMLGMPQFGAMATHGYEFVTTDSAASATAKATGKKTHYNGVSVKPSTGSEEDGEEQNRYRTMVEAAREAGWRTGLAATVRINHATPAPFAGHSHGRHEYDDIAVEMSESGVDLLLGAGYGFFRDRDDGRDLLQEMEARNYTIADDADDVREASADASRLVGLMYGRDMPWVDEGRSMELAEMVDHSIQVLDNDDPPGFFLMVEGAKIDWAGHAMDGERVVSETLDMDRAVDRALEYARDRSDTLVVVSSDHETGAMDVIDGPMADRFLDEMETDDVGAFERTISDGLSDDTRDGLRGPFARHDLGDEPELGPTESDADEMVTSFGYLSAASRAYWDGEGRFSAIHTPEFVPIFAEGPGAREVTSVRDNADLGRQMLSWIDGRERDIGGADPKRDDERDGEPKNVVLIVGDGVGLADLTASYYHHGHSTPFEMSTMGTVATHAADRLVADEASAATAIATGARSPTETVGMARREAGGELEVLSGALTQAHGEGRAVGLITTGSLFDPMPGALFASSQEADNRDEIASQFVELSEQFGPLEFVVGGGRNELDGTRGQRLEEAGVQQLDDWERREDGGGAYHLLADHKLPSPVERSDDDATPTLPEMVSRGLDEVSADDRGFLLVVDAGAVDHQEMGGLGEFEGAAAEAIDFARQDEETLVLVTGLRDDTASVLDNHYGFHSGACGAVDACGGPHQLRWHDVAADEVRHGSGFGDVELQGEYSPPRIAVQTTWLARAAGVSPETLPPAANFIPLFAEGPGEGAFGGFVDQPEIGQWLVDWARQHNGAGK